MAKSWMVMIFECSYQSIYFLTNAYYRPLEGKKPALARYMQQMVIWPSVNYILRSQAFDLFATSYLYQSVIFTKPKEIIVWINFRTL